MNLKTYKLKGLDKYVVNVESKTVAVIKCIVTKIGVTENDLEETELEVPINYIACFMTLQEIYNSILEILPIKKDNQNVHIQQD